MKSVDDEKTVYDPFVDPPVGVVVGDVVREGLCRASEGKREEGGRRSAVGRRSKAAATS